MIIDQVHRHSPHHFAHSAIAGGIVLALLVGVVVLVLHAMTTSRTLALVETMTARADSAFATVEPLSAAEKRRLRTYLNKDHVKTAKAMGFRNVATRESAARLARQGELHRLVTNPLFYVEPMDYSVPYVTESAAHLLDLIGLRFQDALRAESLPPYRFVITSATRSHEDQRALRRVNSNAVRESSHHYGTTVDLNYRKYFYSDENDALPDLDGIREDLLTERLATAYANLGQTHHARLEAILGRVLLDLQREGRVLVIYERRQPVFHITVAQKIDPPAQTTPPVIGP